MALHKIIGLAYGECIGAYLLGLIAQMRGEYERAIARFEQSQRAGRASGVAFMEVYSLGALGSVYLDISEELSERIDERHTQALNLLETPMGTPAGGSAWADLGLCLLAKGKLDRAEEFLQRGLSVPSQQGLVNRPRFMVGLAYVALKRNQPDVAARLVSEARQYVDERAMKHFDPEVAMAEAQVSIARGEFERALERFAQAEAAALRMTMRPMIWQARAESARVLTSLGRDAGAGAKRREADAMRDEIAGLFVDETLRALFVQSAKDKTN